VLFAVGVWLLLRKPGGAPDRSLDGSGVELRHARTRLGSAERAWSELLSELGLPEGSPMDVRRRLDAAERVQSALVRAERSQGQADRLEEELASFAGRLARATESMDVGAPPDIDDVPTFAQKARDAVRAARDARDALERTQEKLRELTRRVAALEDEEKEAVEEALDAYRALGLESGGSPEVVDRLVEEAEESVAEVEREHDALAEERGALVERLENAFQEDAAAVLRLEAEATMQRMRAAAEEYAVCAVGIALLERAQRRYEQERQPEVVRKAQEYLATITNGRYSRLRIPLGGGSVEVVDENGRPVPSELLSRGTAEQLYLALRLGLVDRMGSTGASLPALMDDVLVNFDPERAAGASSALVELSASRQVVVFTCHPSTLELLQRAGDPTVITLGRC
jgi:uncharacterized protein YhaN